LSSKIDYTRVVAAIPEPEWETATLDKRYRSLLDSIRAGFQPLGELLSRSTITVEKDVLGKVYGDLNCEQHMFRVDPLNWGFDISETQVTRGLVHFLSEPMRKVARLKAFFSAFGIDKPAGSILRNAKISAETPVSAAEKTGRIDIEILYDPCTQQNGSKTHQKAIIIEAKLAHRVTPDQLEVYPKDAKQRIVEPAFFILAQFAGDEAKLNDEQRDTWKVVYWDQILMALEKTLLPDEFDTDFQLFRRTLWERVEGSNRKRNR